MRKAHARCLAIAMALVLLLPIAAAAREDSQPLTDDLRTQIIQTAYANLTQYVVNPKRPIRFTLSDFQTLSRHELRQSQIFDLISVPGGDLIELNRKERHLVPTGEKWVEWEPDWVFGVQSFLLTDRARELGLATARAWEVLEIAAEDDRDLLATRSATTYRVTVSFADHSRTYRAMALWMSDHTGEPFNFRLEDPVIGRIDEAVGEAFPAGGYVEMERAISQANLATIPEPESWSCCYPRKNTINQPFAFSSTDDHITGKHETKGTFQTTCNCNKQCFNSCGQNVASGLCRDTGGLTYVYIHNTGANVSLESDFAFFGQPVTCRGGYGCAVRYCLLPIFCSVSVGVSVASSGSVSVSASPKAAIAWKAAGGGTCNNCAIASPYFCLPPGSQIPRPEG